MIKTATYFCSYVDSNKCPDDDKNIFAFIGRSNVGKSSLINVLTNQKNLAKTSVTPGKTKMINYFDINKTFYFVDLPGYGFAQVARAQRNTWEQQLFQFIKNRKLLKQILVLIDASIPTQKMDVDFINKLGEKQVPFIIVFTKSDKEKQSIVQQNITSFSLELQKTWDEMPLNFITSCRKKSGVQNVLNFILNEQA